MEKSTSSRPGLFLLVLVGFVILGIAGCEHRQEEPPEPAISPPSVAVPDKHIDSLAEANNGFALDFYSQLKETEGNLFFSPYSVSMALAMTYGGARGETASQMEKTLHVTLDPEAMAVAFQQFQADLDAQAGEADVQLDVANSLWPQKEYPFLSDYIEMVQERYAARVTLVDYVKAPGQAQEKINAWIEKKTRGKITDMIGPGDLDQLTRLCLVNAIYFKGAWAVKFDKGDTKNAPFTLLDGKKVQVPMMYQKGVFAYGRFKAADVLELSYRGRGFSMLIVLPDKADGLKEVEKNLSVEELQKWRAQRHVGEAEVYLPRFKMTWGSHDLVPALEKLGMHDAFALDKADFSGMTQAERLYISGVLHKAFVEVNEEGTEAAAATVVRIAKNGHRVHTFRADHPFLFFICDKATGCILFMGRVEDPTERP